MPAIHINPAMAQDEAITFTVLPLDYLLRDEHVQQRAQTDMDKVEQYADLYREKRDLGRVVAFYDGDRYLLADGFHRTLAAQLAEVAELPVEVHAGTMRDAILYATGCNLHGKPLTNADKRKRVLTMLHDADWSQWSDNAIARHCGVTHPFVGQLRKSLVVVTSENGDKQPTPSTTRQYINKHGQQVTMHTAAIGRNGSVASGETVPLTSDISVAPCPTEPESLVRQNGQSGTQPMTTEAAPPREVTPAEIDLETLLRTTAQYLEAIQGGLDHGSFAETFDQYAPLWDAVHDGCMHLLDMLDGEPDEPVEVEIVPEPLAVAASSPESSTRHTYGDLTRRVEREVLQRERFACADIAKALGVANKHVWQVLQKLVRKGKLQKDGEEYMVLAVAEERGEMMHV